MHVMSLLRCPPSRMICLWWLGRLFGVVGEAHTDPHSAAPPASVRQLREEAFYTCYLAVGLASSGKLKTVGRDVLPPLLKSFCSQMTLLWLTTEQIQFAATLCISSLLSQMIVTTVGLELRAVGLILRLEFGHLLVFLVLLKSFTLSFPHLDTSCLPVRFGADWAADEEEV